MNCPQIGSVGGHLFSALKQIGDTCPTGLRGYTSVQPGNDEVEITKALHMALRDAGFAVQRERQYPIGSTSNLSGGGRCDLVIDVNGGKLWLEAKVAWTLWYRNKAAGILREATNTDERMQAFVEDCNGKLSGLTLRDASHVGGLLIAFEATECPPQGGSGSCRQYRLPASRLQAVQSALRDWHAGHPPDGFEWQDEARYVGREGPFIGDFARLNRAFFWYRDVA
jgi:hypothetical protein